MQGAAGTLLQRLAGPAVGTGPGRRPASVVSPSRPHAVPRRARPQVVVGSEEATDIAMKRFRREVMNAGVIPEVRGVWGLAGEPAAAASRAGGAAGRAARQGGRRGEAMEQR